MSLENQLGTDHGLSMVPPQTVVCPLLPGLEGWCQPQCESLFASVNDLVDGTNFRSADIRACQASASVFDTDRTDRFLAGFCTHQLKLCRDAGSTA